MAVFCKGYGMANEARAGSFYEFDRSAKGKEIKGVIPRNTALQQVLKKRDVYTPMRSDALSLAKDVQKGKAGRDPAHGEGYFKHFHPASDHETYGHVFYGGRWGSEVRGWGWWRREGDGGFGRQPKGWTPNQWREGGALGWATARGACLLLWAKRNPRRGFRGFRGCTGLWGDA